MLYSGIDDTKRLQCNKLIFVQKENTINKITKIWTDICKLIDLDQAKKDFGAIIKKQEI